MHSSLTIGVILKESTPIIECGGGRQRTVTRSNRMWRIYGWHVYGECLRNIPCMCQRMSGGLSSCEVEPWGIHCVVLSVDAVKDGEYTRHGGGGYETGGDGSAALLP